MSRTKRIKCMRIIIAITIVCCFVLFQATHFSTLYFILNRERMEKVVQMIVADECEWLGGLDFIEDEKYETHQPFKIFRLPAEFADLSVKDSEVYYYYSLDDTNYSVYFPAPPPLPPFNIGGRGYLYISNDSVVDGKRMIKGGDGDKTRIEENWYKVAGRVWD